MEDVARDSDGINSSSLESIPEGGELLKDVINSQQTSITIEQGIEIPFLKEGRKKDRDENNNGIIQRRSDERLQDPVLGSQSSRKSTIEQGFKQAWFHDQTSLAAVRGSSTSNELKSPETIGISFSSEISRLDKYDIFSRRSASENQDGIQRSPDWSFGSPAYYSAHSSPWAGNPAMIKISPMFYSAASSPYNNNVSLPLSATCSPATSSRLEPLSLGPPMCTSQYLMAARERGIILPVDQELNWSGKSNGGQHVEYARGEELPFQVLGTIGMSLTATVEKIRCRRILLARKTMVCGRRLSLHNALIEVQHLQKLKHPHIIQLVGSYMQGKKFSILLYPVADFDLGKFYDEVLNAVLDKQDENQIQPNEQHANCIQAMWSFFACLSDALRYIHSCATKHLDIKPGNILVKKHPSYPYGHRVYIADFGISRCFPALDHSQTGEEILRTPKYCAPEVWNREVHGRAADIFSLGCVFTEMLTVLAGRDLDEFSDFRIHGEERSSAYHATLSRVFDWIEEIRLLLSDREFYRCFLTAWRPIEIKASQASDWVVKEDGIDAIVRMVLKDSKLRTLPNFSFLDLTFTSELVERCSSCTEAREVYRED